MPRLTYNKLVRDKIPDIIRKSGAVPKTHQLNEKEFLKALIKKLHEEVAEFTDKPSAEELADIKEVMIALRETMGIRAGELEDVRRQKAKTNGRFRERIFLETVDS